MPRDATLKILATADFHGDKEAFRKVALKADSADVVIVCGDVTHFGLLVQARDLLSPLSRLKVPALLVPGNCDMPSLADERMGSVESIHGRCKAVGGFSFLGVGGSSPSPFATPFELEEAEIARILETAQSTCNNRRNEIVVSHSPPRDTRTDVAFNGQHVGSHSVRGFIEKHHPRLVICGHIHEAQGVDRIGETLIVNPGPARHGHYALINLDDKAEFGFGKL